MASAGSWWHRGRVEEGGNWEWKQREFDKTFRLCVFLSSLSSGFRGDTPPTPSCFILSELCCALFSELEPIVLKTLAAVSACILLTCFSRFLLFICVWLWIFSPCSRSSIWCQPDTNVWPKPRLQSAPCSNLWITLISFIIFCRLSVWASSFWVCVKQCTAYRLWTTGSSAAWLWLWCNS